MANNIVKYLVTGALLSCGLLVLVTVADTNALLSGAPVGLSILQAGQLLSNPYQPFIGSDAGDLGSHLQPITTNGSVQVLLWDAAAQKYSSYALTADGLRDSSNRLATVILEPGMGFFVATNSLSSNQVYVLAGRVNCDGSTTNSLPPGLSILGTPYSGQISVTNSGLAGVGRGKDKDKDKDRLTDMMGVDLEALTPGAGAWFKRTGNKARLWVESRPYQSSFVPEGALPAITGIRVKHGKEVMVSIECDGRSALDIYTKSVPQDAPLDLEKGWEISEVNINPNGRTTLEWYDTGFATFLSSESGNTTRYYLIGNASIDMDMDGVPDCRSKYVFGVVTPDFLSQTSSNLTSDVRVPTTGALNNQTGVARVTGKVIYVDRSVGLDVFSGKSPVVLDSVTGPKKSIHAGIVEAEQQAGPQQPGRLVIKAGSYGSENINVLGRNVFVTSEGMADFTRPDPSTIPPIPVPNVAIVITNDISNVVTNK